MPARAKKHETFCSDCLRPPGWAWPRRWCAMRLTGASRSIHPICLAFAPCWFPPFYFAQPGRR